MRQIGENFIAAGVVVTGDVVFSRGVNIWFGSILRGDLARITLGDRVNLQDGCIVHTDFGEDQIIEDDVVVGHRVTLHGKRIGQGTLVGMGAILLSGSEIGPECLIAAGSLVPEGKRIPPRSVVMGLPGKIVREVTEEDLQRIRKINAHYLNLARRYAAGEFPAPWDRKNSGEQVS